MGGRALGGALAITTFVLASCAGNAGRPNATTPATTDTVVQSNLVVPWDVAVASDGRLFVSERPGTVDVFESTAPSAKRVATMPIAGVRAMGEAGVLGIALDPEFSANGRLYVCASRTEQAEWRNQVLRYRVSADSLALEGIVMRMGPQASGIHDACRLRFAPDGKLWIATGDAGMPSLAQEVSSLNGKVLRMNPDGTVPTDNPVMKGASAPSLVYAMGFRNPGGLAFHPGTGACYVVDAGDQAQDEIDLVQPGANFGWPLVLGPGGTGRGLSDPLWSSGPTNFASAGAAFIAGDRWGTWNGALAVATLKEQSVRVFSIDGTHVQLRETILDRRYGRLRGVTLAPDGALLVTTSNGSGDRIIRITPRAL